MEPSCTPCVVFSSYEMSCLYLIFFPMAQVVLWFYVEVFSNPKE